MSAAVAFCVMFAMCVNLAMESYTKELHSVRQGDGISSNTDGTECPVPVPSFTRSSANAWSYPRICFAKNLSR